MASESKAGEMARAQVLSWLEAHDWNVANACASMLWLSPDKAIELEREARREAFTEAARMAREAGERRAGLVHARPLFNLAHSFARLAARGANTEREKVAGSSRAPGQEENAQADAPGPVSSSPGFDEGDDNPSPRARLGERDPRA